MTMIIPTVTAENMDIDITGINEDIKYVKQKTVTQTKNIYHAYINGEISSDAKFYYPLIQLLNTADKNDEIFLHVNSQGGKIYDAIEIINALNICPATLTLHVTGFCASAATLIAFGATFDQCIIGKYTNFLFHPATSFNWGKTNDLYDSAVNLKEYTETIMRQAYKDILTPDELKQIFENGKELYISGDVIQDRLIDRALKRQKEDEKLEKKAKKK